MHYYSFLADELSKAPQSLDVTTDPEKLTMTLRMTYVPPLLFCLLLAGSLLAPLAALHLATIIWTGLYGEVGLNGLLIVFLPILIAGFFVAKRLESQIKHPRFRVEELITMENGHIYVFRRFIGAHRTNFTRAVPITQIQTLEGRDLLLKDGRKIVLRGRLASWEQDWLSGTLSAAKEHHYFQERGITPEPISYEAFRAMAADTMQRSGGREE